MTKETRGTPLPAGIPPAGLLARLRSGAWLLPRRLAHYPWLILGMAVLGGGLWVVLAQSGLDRRGMPLGADFLGFWAAGKVALGQGGAAVANAGALRAAQAEAFGRPVPFFLWLYPPTATLLVSPLGLLPYGAAWAVWILGQLAAAWAVLRRLPPHRLTARLFLAAPVTLMTVAQGQNGLLSAALLGGGLLLLPRRPGLAGLVLAGLAYKPHLALLLPVALLAARQGRALAGAGLGVLAFIGASLLAFGPAAWTAFLEHGDVARQVLEQGGVGWGKMASVYAGLRLLGLPSAAAWTGQAAAGLAAALAVWRLWRGAADWRDKAAGLAFAAPLATPFLLDYDLTLWAVAVAFATARGREAGFRPWEKTLLALAWGLPAVLRPFGLGLGLPLAPLAGALLLVSLLQGSRLRPAAARACR